MKDCCVLSSIATKGTLGLPHSEDESNNIPFKGAYLVTSVIYQKNLNIQ